MLHSLLIGGEGLHVAAIYATCSLSEDAQHQPAHLERVLRGGVHAHVELSNRAQLSDALRKLGVGHQEGADAPPARANQDPDALTTSVRACTFFGFACATNKARKRNPYPLDGDLRRLHHYVKFYTSPRRKVTRADPLKNVSMYARKYAGILVIAQGVACISVHAQQMWR